MYPAPPVTRTVRGGGDEARATIDDAHDDSRKTKNRGLAGKVKCRRRIVAAVIVNILSRRVTVAQGVKRTGSVTRRIWLPYELLFACERTRTVRGQECENVVVLYTGYDIGGSSPSELAVLVEQLSYYTTGEE
jgi:hypothetical protein